MSAIITSVTFSDGVSTWIRDCADLSGNTITVNGVTYDCNYCGDFAIYYVGRKGGWNTFLFEGPCKKVDKLTDHKYNRAVNNTTINFENNKYRVDINARYELYTGLLTDEEAEIFAKDVISTPKMYLHNLKTNEIIPAVVVDSQAEYKTFKNQGKKFVQYKLTVEESQTKYRR